MWREGFDLELVAWALNALALAFGAGLGLRALIDPAWAARFVRLKADDARPGGFAEFRATYGGVLLALHAAALVFSLQWIFAGALVAGMFATGAAGVIAAGWGGAAFGRLLSFWRDRTRTRFNLMSALAEGLIACAIAAPWLVWIFQRRE